MAEHHAFGVAGAARGVLKEGRRIGVDGRACHLPARDREVGDGHHCPQRFAARAQQLRERLRLGHREQQPGLGVAQDAGNALQVVFELRQARRGIRRHRHTAGVQRAVERREEVASGRQHHGHRVTGAAAPLGEARSHRERVDAQPCIGEVRRRAVLRLDRHQQPLTMPLGVPVEHVDQGGERCGRIFDAESSRGARAWMGTKPRPARRRWRAAGRGASRPAKGQRFERHAKFALDPRQELGARKAVQPIVAFKRVVDAQDLREIVSRAQLVGEIAHQPQQRRRQIAIDGHR